MPKYAISPSGVSKALKATAAQAEKLDTIVKPLGPAFVTAATASGKDSPIVGALHELLGDKSTQLKGMGERIAACLTGCATASRIYVSRDQEMSDNTKAKQAQAEAIAKADRAAR